MTSPVEEGADGDELMSAVTEAATPSPRRLAALLVSILILSACGITYELLIGAIASYLLGGSVTQFSLTIGVFLASMGLGAYLSRFVKKRLLEKFIGVEIALAAVGGLSGPVLFLAFTYTEAYHPVMFGLIVAVGALIGLEIPLLTRYFQRFRPLADSLAHVFSLDYLGSLIASILFPLILLPYLGIFKTSLAVGLLNLAVGFATLLLFSGHVRGKLRQLFATFAVATLLVATLVASGSILSVLEARLYRDQIIHVEQSRFQRIVLTRYRDDIRMHLNGNLQFSSRDEYRYHEALVHLAASASASREHVLIIGGGDGMAIREVLRYPDVRRVTLVDLDDAVVRLARKHPAIRALNKGSLDHPKVRVVHADGYDYLRRSSDTYGVILVDLPDPRSEVLTKLYSTAFYRIVDRHLAAGGVAVTQATSALFARAAFWCIDATARAAGLITVPFHAYIPSFGDWGFVLMSRRPVRARDLEKALGRHPMARRFVVPKVIPSLLSFPPDQSPLDVQPSTLDRPVILKYYERGWNRWF